MFILRFSIHNYVIYNVRSFLFFSIPDSNFLINLQKVAGALTKPKGITRNWNKHWGVTKPV